SIPLFTTMKAKLDYLSERQAILAQNIANADTPNYQAKDVQPPNFSKSLAHSTHQLQLVSTNKNHLSGRSINSSSSRIINRDSTYERNPTGNNVVIEEEMSKVAANQGEYQKVLNLYRKSIDMFKTAIGKTGG
ncbi:MAG: flagellar basal body rod protein FlgB, partial [Rickettsiales bacterium]